MFYSFFIYLLYYCVILNLPTHTKPSSQHMNNQWMLQREALCFTFCGSNTFDGGCREATSCSDFKERKEGVWGGEGGCEGEGETVGGVGGKGGGLGAGEMCRAESRVAGREDRHCGCHLGRECVCECVCAH